MTQAEQFFYDNAGFSFDPKTETEEQGHERCARELAQAEVWAAENGYTFDCQPDPDPDGSFIENSAERAEWEANAWGMVMFHPNGEVAQSLWGCDGDSDYKRVVRAELAAEEMANEVSA